MKPDNKVICVNDNNLYQIPVRRICEGIVYTVTEIFECKCRNVYVRLAEVNEKINMWCPKCNQFKYTTFYYHIERFRSLEQAENTEEKKKTKKGSWLNTKKLK